MGNVSYSLKPRTLGRAFKVRYTKGETIYSQSDRTGHWFEIVSGAVRTCRIRVDGKRRVTGFFFPGDVIGAPPGRRNEMAEALTDTLLCGYAVEMLDEKCDRSIPETLVNHVLESIEASLFLLGRGSAVERVAAFLVSIANRTGDSDRLPLPMSREDIADHLGLTPYTVSRTLKKMERGGIVAGMGRNAMRIIDRSALLAMVGDELPMRPIC